jgi:hypothetical protein
MLSRLTMKLMASAPWTELLQFDPIRIVAAVLLGRVIAFPAVRAFERNRMPVSLRLLRHCTSSHPDEHIVREESVASAGFPVLAVSLLTR